MKLEPWVRRYGPWIEDRLHARGKAIFEFSAALLIFATADPTTTSILVGLACTLAGQLFRIWAVGYYHGGKLLTTNGPYALTRDPIQFGSFLVLLGLALAGRSMVATSLVILGSAIVYSYRQRLRERSLDRTLGPAYGLYRKGVSGFLPQLVPSRWVSSHHQQFVGRFSLRRALLRKKHRELDALITTSLGFGLLYLCTRLDNKAYFHGAILILAGAFVIGRIAFYARRQTNQRQSAHAI